MHSEYKGNELLFENIFVWATDGTIKCSVNGDIIYLLAKFKGRQFFLPPLTKRKSCFCLAVNNLLEWCKRENVRFKIAGVTKEMINMLGECADKFEVIHDRNFSEYLYEPNSLITLAGKKLHGKRNHLNRFLKAGYDYRFRDYEARDFDSVMKLVDEWQKGQENASYLDSVIERKAIAKALEYCKELGLLSSVIEIRDSETRDYKIVAWTLGYITFNNIGNVVFEKADKNYEGIYAAINNFFVKDKFANCKLVNRQEDLGIEGIRKTKLAYRPIGFVDKYIIVEKGSIDWQATSLS